MKKPYFSFLGAIVCGAVVALAVVAMFSDEMWVPLAGMIWSFVFGVPFLFFSWRVLRYYSWLGRSSNRQG